MRALVLSCLLLCVAVPAWAQEPTAASRRNIAPNAPFGSEIYTDGDNPEHRDPDQPPVPPGSDPETKVTPTGAIPHPVILYPFGNEGMPRHKTDDVHELLCPKDDPKDAPDTQEKDKILLEKQEPEAPTGGGIRAQPVYGAETRWGITKRCYVKGYPRRKDPAAGDPARPVVPAAAPVRPSHMMLNPYAPVPAVLPSTPVAKVPNAPAPTVDFATSANAGFAKPPVLTPQTRDGLNALTPVQQQRYTATLQSMVRQNPNRTPTDQEIQLLTQAAKG